MSIFFSVYFSLSLSPLPLSLFLKELDIEKREEEITFLKIHVKSNQLSYHQLRKEH